MISAQSLFQKATHKLNKKAVPSGPVGSKKRLPLPEGTYA